MWEPLSMNANHVSGSKQLELSLICNWFLIPIPIGLQYYMMSQISGCNVKETMDH